jgi:hypothetical protein
MLKSVLAVVLMLASGALSQKTVAPAAGGTVRVPEFENNDVRVWKAIVAPNAPLTMHRHDHPRVIVALAGGDMKIVQQSGESETEHWETGKAYWLAASKPGISHADVNTGKKAIEVMVVELKKER